MRIQALLISTAFVAFAVPAAAQAQQTTILDIDYELPEPTRPAGPSEAAANASPAPAQAEISENAIALEGSVTVADGRIFQDQLLDLSPDPVTEISLSATYRGWTLGLWHAESLIGKRDDRETDVTLSRAFLESGGFTVSGQVGVYIIPGLDPIYEAKVTVAHSVGAGCEAALSAEIMRDGFVDEVLRGQLSCSRVVAPRLTIDATPSISLSNFGGGVSFGGEAGISYQLSDDLTLRVFYQGYTSGIGSGHRAGVTLGFAL